MAEGVIREGKSLEQLEKEVTCNVCKQHYAEPKVLSCLHYFCKNCILQLTLSATTSNQPFSCPECHQEAPLPKGGVEELKTAYFVNVFQSHLSMLNRIHGKVETKCEECTDSGNKAEAFCHQCAMFVCTECVRQHKRMKSFASHRVVSLEELKQEAAREVVVEKPPANPCLVHEEPFNIYCFDCNSLICRDCTATVHNEHHFEFSKTAAPSTKKELMSHLDSLGSAAVTLSSPIADIQTVKQEVEAQGRSVANTIHSSFDQLQLLLDKHKQQLLQEAADQIQCKMNKLSDQEECLALATATVRNIVDYTERFVEYSADSEVMSMHTEILERIDQEVTHGKLGGWCLEPVEEADMGVKVVCDESLLELFQTRAKITRLALYPAQFQVSSEGTQTAEVNKIAIVTLTARTLANKTARRRVVVVGELKSLCDGSVVKCEVGQSGPGEYHIQYTPTVRGRHELSVSVDGKYVAGSPLPVSVTISPTLLGKPVKVWRGIPNPVGIATNSLGDVIVTTCDGEILRIDKNQDKMVLIESSLSKIVSSSYLSSVSTDSDDFVYSASAKSNKILCCNRDGGSVRVHELEQVRGPGYKGMSVIRDEVMVCECKNKGTFLVYDREFNFIKRVEKEGMGEFRNVARDQQGNLYVVDSTKAFVRVFNKDGVLVNSFDGDKNRVKKLKSPYAICISGPYVYVTNHYGHNVSVFTTAGSYVTSLGEHGDAEGDFRHPYSVCVDLDNYIYVTDYSNNRIQCF